MSPSPSPKEDSTKEAPEPEPRWPALLAILAVGGLGLALPPSLTMGPRWLLLAVLLVVLVPTVISHRAGMKELNRKLGFAVSSIVTLALIGSLVFLITGLSKKQETPGELLVSAAALWATNVLVFALWYWRLDAGGPHARDRRENHKDGAFFFPQMMESAPVKGPWSPNFMDYLFLAFNTSTAFSPTDIPILSRWAKALTMLQSLISLVIVAILASRAVGLL